MAANYWVSTGRVQVLELFINLVDGFVEVSFHNGRTYRVDESSSISFGSRCVSDTHQYQLLYKEFSISELIALHAWNVFGNLKSSGQYVNQIYILKTHLKSSDLEKVQKCADRFAKYKFLPHGPHIRLYNLA